MFAQIKRHHHILLAQVLSISIFFALLICIRLVFDIPLEHLTRDVVSLGGLPWYSGILSELGIIVWSVALGVGILGTLQQKGRTRKLLYALTILTAFLLLDDAFTLHESVYSVYFGLHELIVFGVYALFAIWTIYSYRDIIIKSEHIYLVLTIAAFFLSLVFDHLIGLPKLHYLAEDGFKFIGIVNWMLYMIYLSRHPFKKIEKTT